MKIKKDWFGMFSSTREYARSIYVREPTEEVEKRIWTKRIKTAGVLMAALLLSFLYCLFQPSDTQEILDGYVVRRQEQEQSLAVTAESNDGQKLWQKELELAVSDRDFTEKEKENLDGRTKKYLESELLGENQSLQHVDKPLHLPDSMPSTQMEIHWTVEDTYLNEDGSLCKEQIPKSGVDTEVTAEASWKNWKKIYSFPIHIAPVKWSEKSLWEKNVEQAVAKQMEEQADKEVVKLPETIDGKKVRYILKSEEKSYALVYLVLALIICLPVFWRMQQKKEQTLRREQLLLDHPAVVNQFMLLLGAGLSVRKVIERLVSEYEKKCQRGGKKRYVYEELGVAMRQMHDGVSETKAVECFGRRCLLQQYLRFCSLITQNMKKGAEGMLAILETEAMDSLERRKEHALQLGEKAGTRLLFPMMLMLLIVMGIIMVPAFMTM